MFKQVMRESWGVAVQFFIFFLDEISKLLIWLGERSRTEILVIFAVVVLIFGSSQGSKTPNHDTQNQGVVVLDQNKEYTDADRKKDDEKAKAEIAWQIDILKIRSIRDSMKNPASFVLVDVTKTDDGTLCLTYRGTNSFNAITTERIAVLSNAQIGRWNASCAGKYGQDLKYIKHAI